MKGTSVMWNYIMEEQEVLGRMLCDKALFEMSRNWNLSILWPMAVPTMHRS